MRINFTIMAAALMVPMPAHAEPQAPNGKWIVDFAESQCVAVLPFGDSDDPEMLLIKPVPSGNHVQVAMVSDGRKRNAVVREGEIKLNGTVRDAQLLHYGTRAKKQVYRFMVPGPIEAMSGLERIEMTLPRDEYDLAVPEMESVSKALADCLSNLRTYWNVDNEALAQGPRGDVRGLFRSSDYPAQAIRERENGINRAYLLIDEKGKVADCTLSAFAGNVILAAQTCALLTARAEFEPARDADGNAVRSSYSAPTIVWSVPNARQSLDELRAEMDRLTDADGNCLEFGGTC